MSSKKTTKVTKTAPVIAKGSVAGAIPKNLGELRSNFDGLRDVAKKLPESSMKTTLLTKIEENYLGAAFLFTSHMPTAGIGAHAV